MTPPPTPPFAYFIPYKTMQLVDGSTLIKPGKPVLMMGAREAAKYTRLSTKTLARLAESGFIRVALPTPRIPMYFPGEIMDFIQETIDNPDYWTDERRRQYGMARRVKK